MGGQEPKLRVHLFGEFRVLLNDQLLPPSVWPQRKTEALLKVLVAKRGRVFTQDQLIDLLFADLDIDKAVKSLYNRISELRKALEPNLTRGNQSQYILRVGQGRYCFSDDVDCYVDTEAIDALLDNADGFKRLGRWSEAVHTYNEALALYEGEYLAEDRYEEWALDPRQSWHKRFEASTLELADCHAQLKQFVRAVACCDRVIAHQPSSEIPYRLKMMYLDELGRHNEVAATYAACESALKQAFDLEPTLETQTVYEDIVERTHSAVAIPEPGSLDIFHQEMRLVARRKTPDGNVIASFLKRMSLASVLALIVIVVSAAAVTGWWGINQFNEFTKPAALPSIAILPFLPEGREDPSGIPFPLEDLADGAAMTLTHALTRMPGIRVASSTLSFSLSDQQLDFAEIGKRLNVDAILQGSMRRSGNELRVDLELINVEDGLRIWSDRYNIEIDVNAFAGLKETVPLMVEAIVDKLEIDLNASIDNNIIDSLKKFFSL
jgi:DNA-binding SARP family transcriptional activator/TolB-like protein